MRRAFWVLASCMALPLVAAEQDHRKWIDYGGGPDSSHFVALDQINKSNVRQLQVAWTYPTGDDHAYLFNPIIVDDVMYVLAKNSSLVALNAATGKEIWIHANLPGLTTRGIAYWESKDGKDRRLIFTMNHYLEEIDARTGKRLWHFQMVHHDLWDYDATAAPQLLTVRHEGKLVDVVAQSSKQGFLYVFDRVTGKPLWPIEERPVAKSLMPGEQAWPTQGCPKPSRCRERAAAPTGAAGQ